MICQVKVVRCSGSRRWRYTGRCILLSPLPRPSARPCPVARERDKLLKMESEQRSLRNQREGWIIRYNPPVPALKKLIGRWS